MKVVSAEAFLEGCQLIATLHKNRPLNSKSKRVNDQQYTLTGDLTFHGVTKPLTLRSNLIGQSKDSKGESHTGSDIYLVIKRSEFGIKGDSPAVGDEIFLTIRVRN